MEKFMSIFRKKKSVIGVLHVDALPGTPSYDGSVEAIVEQTLSESAIYQNAGIDALIVENMHDVPYCKGTAGPEITATMTRLAHEVKQQTGLPCGIQILAAANVEAVAAAMAAGLDFVRVEGFVYGHLADEGYIDACAGNLLRYRKQIGAEHIAVFTDIKKKHSSHAITADVDIEETAVTAEFFCSDGLILTGPATGTEANLTEVEKVKNKVDIPILIGSGINAENVTRYLEYADAVIVGSAFKEDGHWANAVSAARVQQLLERAGSFT